MAEQRQLPPKKLRWTDVKALTPVLFFPEHNGTSPPPDVARRLWAAIAANRLNEYVSDVDRSGAKAVLMTLAMIYQEFRLMVYRSGHLLCPKAMTDHLTIPSSHVAEILNDNKISCTYGGTSLSEILTLDATSRDCVAEAILDHFQHEDEVFRLLAFPTGLSRSERTMPLWELIASLDEKSERLGLEWERPDWNNGCKFIQSGFQRTIDYQGSSTK